MTKPEKNRNTGLVLNDIMTKAQMAEALQLNIRSAERLLLTGQVKGARTGKEWRVTKGAVMEYIERVEKETAAALKGKDGAAKDKIDASRAKAKKAAAVANAKKTVAAKKTGKAKKGA